ncbi:glycosyltransferase family 1 protein [Collinsella tanakaei]|nr:glycosyltransferase family 1 protein [Collinsella tanakaei]
MGAPIRVAQVMGYMDGGGVEQVVMNYYRHIDRSRVQFDFLVCEGSGMVPREEIESMGGRVFMVPPYKQLIRYMREMERLFREERWPIVHSHVNTLSVFPLRAAKRAGVPVRIAHSHSTSGGHDPAKNAMKALLRPLSNVYPTHRAACSRHAGEWLFGKGHDFTVIPNAIDLASFWFDPVRREAVRQGLGVEDGQLVVGHVGRFSPPKNQSALVRSFALVAERRPDARLVLVGEGRQRADVEALAASLCPEGSVLFLGQRDDVADLYQAFDVFCLPSEYEGLGMVAVEAEAAGLPCVLSSAVPRDADPTRTAIFLDANSEGDWAKTMASIIPGERIQAYLEDFTEYDIRDASKTLGRMYLSLLPKCIIGDFVLSKGSK